ncbi:alpha/beta fold hydrolase [Pinirhizobacter soli]|uniref:alpha/beta fold hydrolase n=1 Tax=Pinirhizobacter soli TaxID=2786953 RepID=UPI00202A6A7B|nr:alpha/beta hydrolase [Pinirhizobacter soli]
MNPFPSQKPLDIDISRRNVLGASLLAAATAAMVAPLAQASATGNASTANAAGGKDRGVRFHKVSVDGFEVFYREAGPTDAPVLLLLHGFPTASHMFRDLIPHLAGKYRLIAPDLPGFGQTFTPKGTFDYTFDNLTTVIDGFTQALKLKRYALYIFDYGAPVGLRLALAHPERVTAIITQNGNAYMEGFSDAWGTLQAYWAEPTLPHREACRDLISRDTIENFQYFHGAPRDRVSPDGYELDIAYLARKGADEIQLDLIYDYRNNIKAYPAFHEYFRSHRPPILAVWGKNDPAFIPAGALAYKKDSPTAEVHLLDAGHFALETHAAEIGALMVDFLSRVLK